METKYGFMMPPQTVKLDVDRLTNQLWKLIPMRENNENWRGQLETLIIELTGMNEIFNIKMDYLILLSKLEGLRLADVEFLYYRKTVFECISLLRGICHGQQR